jgi:phage shock protein A
MNLTSIREDALKLIDSGSGRVCGVRIDALAEQVLDLIEHYEQQGQRIEQLNEVLHTTRRRLKETLHIIEDARLKDHEEGGYT